MGLFDGIMKAFGNENYASPPEGVKATARHILVKTKDEATMVMDKIERGGSFASMASQYSTCPSKNQGGSLGSFRPGVMVPAFDKVIFDPETKLNEVVGPVMTPVSAFSCRRILIWSHWVLIPLMYLCFCYCPVWIPSHFGRKTNGRLAI
jgi:peptidyl-prolyl cis-trans isomerase C